MDKIIKYQDFLNRVDELGFMALSQIMPGLPSLVEETPENNWHTNDDDTDPWRWKDRAAQEKRMAYGCTLGRHKGFVSARMYPFFYAVYHPMKSVQEMWTDGQLSQTTWELWKLFEKKSLLSTSEIRHAMGVTKKKGGSKVDASIRELQRYYYITVAGNRRKVNQYGQPYGWAACVYEKVTDWVPADWMNKFSRMYPEEAREKILDRGMAIGKDFNRGELAKALDI